MKVKKIIGIAAIVFFCACAIFSGVVFAHQYKDAKNSAEQFENLTDLISEVDTSVLEPTHEDNETDNGETNSEEPVTELTDEERASLEAELAKEMMLVTAMSRETILRSYLSKVKDNYDYVLIDCMPSLGMVTLNALAAADSVCHGHHAECGRPASVPHGKNDAGKLRVHCYAQSGIYGQIGACEVAEHFGHPAFLYHQC